MASLPQQYHGRGSKPSENYRLHQLTAVKINFYIAPSSQSMKIPI